MVEKLRNATPAEKVLYLFVLNFRGPVSLRTRKLSERLGISIFTLNKARNALISKGVIRCWKDGYSWVYEPANEGERELRKFKELDRLAN